MIDVKSRGSGYYRVYVDDVEISQHITEREAEGKAIEEAINLAFDNPSARVHYAHDYEVDVTINAKDITLKAISGGTLTQPDSEPDPIAGLFVDETDVTASTTRLSNEIQILGVDSFASVTIEVSGDGGYRLNGGLLTTAPGVGTLGDLIALEHQSNAGAGLESNTTLTLDGTVSDTFTSTTESGVGLPTPDFYVSLTGDDSDGLTPATAKQTVAGGLALALSGDIVQIEPGNYVESNLSIPSNVILQSILGTAFIKGANNGENIINMSGTGSILDGIVAHEAIASQTGSLRANCLNVTGTNNVIRNSIFRTAGLYRHSTPVLCSGENNLMEDCGACGKGRYVVQAFGARNNTFRRIIVRWDKYDEGTGQPIAGISMYNVNGMIVENCVSMDFDEPEAVNTDGGDFYSPWNTSVWPEGNFNNRWYGNMTVGTSLGRTGSQVSAFYADTQGGASGQSINNICTDFYIRDNESDVFTAPGHEYTITNLSRFLEGGASGRPDGPLNDSTITANDPPGADISVQYVDGVKTTNSLFPFKNEAAIKVEFGKVTEGTTGGQRGWVTSGKSLEDYVKDI